ncbi:MAG: hypothetical protein K6C30_05885 [Bacteroidaceae bacterium]|nr:hypothetical protein [Bacteroidaceae bacterium]
MKRIFVTLVLALALLPSINARYLVVTLYQGQRIAFDIEEQNVQMTHNDKQLFFNGYAITRSRIKELRIFTNLPDGATYVNVDTPLAADAKPAVIYDLSGRRVTDLKPGFYIINNKKVVIR